MRALVIPAAKTGGGFIVKNLKLTGIRFGESVSVQKVPIKQEKKDASEPKILFSNKSIIADLLFTAI